MRSASVRLNATCSTFSCHTAGTRRRHDFALALPLSIGRTYHPGGGDNDERQERDRVD
jgi:hypothetical protein